MSGRVPTSSWAMATLPGCIIRLMTSTTRPFRPGRPTGFDWWRLPYLADIAPDPRAPSRLRPRLNTLLGRARSLGHERAAVRQKLGDASLEAAPIDEVVELRVINGGDRDG